MVTRALWLCSLLLGSCSFAPDTPTVRFHTADEYPSQLSAWGLLSRSGSGITLAPGSRVYALNTALFSDYAHKLRTVYVPEGQQVHYSRFEQFEMPVGSIISKTFFYATNASGELEINHPLSEDPAEIDWDTATILETRLLVRQEDGWDALPYVWDGNDAYLKITGDLMELKVANESPLPYLVPSRNQCASCHATNHTTGANQPIGIKARHLNRPDPVADGNQLVVWGEAGLISGLPEHDEIPANASMENAETSLDHKARSYLDVNCGHCHNPAGAADTSGLMLDYQDHDPGAMGVCKPPIAAGRGSGGFLYSIVPGDAERSILTYRMNTSDPATMMPELGRSRVHTEGFELISAWINDMEGECL